MHQNVVKSREPPLLLDCISSPLGSVLLVTDPAGVLRALDYEDYAARMHRLLRLHYARATLVEGSAPRELKAHLHRYFEGDLYALKCIAWATGGTAFQRCVWNTLAAIAPGETMTYGALARALGKPAAARAVGLANGSNPVGIVVPCHRVIGADGKLTGYGGGLHRKHWLLRHEGVQVDA